MAILKSFSELNQITRPFVLAAGVFDGVHLGHREVIRRAVEEARQIDAAAGVLTFFPPPAEILVPGVTIRTLASRRRKMELLAECGATFVLELEFDRRLAALSAREFLQELAGASGGNCRGISAGSDWSFGAGRSGNLHFLGEEGARLGIAAFAVEPICVDGHPVSSTRIRKAVEHGDLVAAAHLLGRRYEIEGEVVRGASLGKQLGFPTANIRYGNALLPPNGVYAVLGKSDGFACRGAAGLPGVANLGVRPTLPGIAAVPVLEAHFPGFSGDLYGERLCLEFTRFVRPERKFASLDALRSQIAMDVREAASG